MFYNVLKLEISEHPSIVILLQSTENLYTHPFNPVFFISSTAKNFEILP